MVRQVAERRWLRYGELSGRRNDGITTERTMNPDCDVLGVHIGSACAGVDLVRSRVAIYLVSNLSEQEYRQTLARVNRPGQARDVVAVHLSGREESLSSQDWRVDLGHMLA